MKTKIQTMYMVKCDFLEENFLIYYLVTASNSNAKFRYSKGIVAINFSFFFKFVNVSGPKARQLLNTLWIELVKNKLHVVFVLCIGTICIGPFNILAY